MIVIRKNHDAWILYNTFAVGIVIYDEESRILYQQHESDMVGGFDIGKKVTIKDRFKNLISKKKKGIRSKIAEVMLEFYKNKMNEDMCKKLALIKNASIISGIKI